MEYRAHDLSPLPGGAGSGPYRSMVRRDQAYVGFVDEPGRARFGTDLWLLTPLLLLGVLPFVLLALVGVENPVELGLGSVLTLTSAGQLLRELRRRRRLLG